MSLISKPILILAWSQEEASKILKTYKAYENEPPDMISKKSNPDPNVKLVDDLTAVKSVYKPDAITMISAFESLENIVKASIEDLTLCSGFCPEKP